MKNITVHKKCTNPGCEGELKFNHSVFPTYPQLYLHVCDRCGKKKNLKAAYPTNYTQYEEHETEERWE